MWDLVQYAASTFYDVHYENFEEFSAAFQADSLFSWRTATVADLPYKLDEQPLPLSFSFFYAVEKMARYVETEASLLVLVVFINLYVDSEHTYVYICTNCSTVRDE